MAAPSGKESISAPAAATDVTRQELPYRLRQQSLLGEFGRSALQTRDIEQILQRATELCAQGLETPFAKVLEYMPDDERLLVRAGVGWASGWPARCLLASTWNPLPVTLSKPDKWSFPTTSRRKRGFERQSSCRITGSGAQSTS